MRQLVTEVMISLDKYFYNGKSEIKVNVTEVKNSIKNTATVGELIRAEFASVVYFLYFLHTAARSATV